MLVSTRAILLRSHPFSESSLILRFLTPDRGLVSVIARGVRRRAPPQLFSIGQLVLHYRKNRELQNYREFAVTDAHQGLGADIQRFAGASLFADLVLHHAGEEPSAELFSALDAGFGHLAEASPGVVLPLVLAGAWALVALLGYAPELAICMECGRAMEAEEAARFDYSAGGVLCSACAETRPGAPRIGPWSRDHLGALLEGRYVSALDRPLAHLCVLRNYVHHHISGSRPLPSFAFLERVAAEADRASPGSAG